MSKNNSSKKPEVQPEPEETPTGHNFYLAEKRTQVFHFPLEQIKVITDQGHPLWDSAAERPFDEENVKSILEHGIINPIQVYMDGPIRTAVDGRGRTIDLTEANRRLVEWGKEPLLMACIMVTKVDVLTLMKRAMVANTHRYQKTPLQMAAQIQHMMKFNLTEAEIAQACKTSIDTVKNNIKLLSCSPKVREAVENNQISVTAARMFFDMSLAEQDRILPDVIPLRGSKQTREIEAKKRAAKAQRAAKLPTVELKTPPDKGAVAAAIKAGLNGHKPSPPTKTTTPAKRPKSEEPTKAEMRTYREIIALRREVGSSTATVDVFAQNFCDWVLGRDDALDAYPVIAAKLGRTVAPKVEERAPEEVNA